MIKNVLKKLSQNQNLSYEETKIFMELIVQNEATPAQIGAFILGMTAKTPTVEELTGIVEKLREYTIKVGLPNKNIVCCCGTGSDNSGSFNVSTAAAILASSDNETIVAKHANCAISSKCGSSDVLEDLGIKLAKTPEEAIEQVKKSNITFLHSPFFNVAVSKINPIRQELGIRTLFNFTGPMINPVSLSGQAFGVSSLSMAEKMIEVLKNIGSKKVMIFTGIDPKIDEISVCGETKVFKLENGKIEKFSIFPEDFGIKRVKIEDIKGFDAKKNASIIKNIFQGKIKDAKLDIVAINAAALFWAADKVQKLEDGLSISYNLIEQGLAYKKLEELK